MNMASSVLLRNLFKVAFLLLQLGAFLFFGQQLRSHPAFGLQLDANQMLFRPVLHQPHYHDASLRKP